MHRLAAMIRGQGLRFVFWEINRLQFLCGNDTAAVAMHFAMKNGQICFSLRKFLAISLAIQKIANDCGCDAVVHLGQGSLEHPQIPGGGGVPGSGRLLAAPPGIRSRESSCRVNSWEAAHPVCDNIWCVGWESFV